MPDPVIMVTAADVSGDAHAAGLIAALRRRLGSARFIGVGGRQMAAAGCELLEEPASKSAMLTHVLPQIMYYRRLIKKVDRAFAEHRPAVHVPVDSPMMNWHLAKSARRHGVPVAYYIAPQVWAWGSWRVGKLRRRTDAVACILPFEPDYLRPRGVNATFVGHPLFDRLAPARPPDIASSAAGGQWRIALLAGSRPHEIQCHSAALVAVMDGLAKLYPKASFTFPAVDEPAASLIRQSAGRQDLPIIVGDTSAVLAQSHFAVTTSGTVTLELAHFGVPMVIFYHANFWAYNLLARWVIRTPYLSLVNILARRELCPELMPWFGRADLLLDRAKAMLADPAGMVRIRQELLELVAPLKTPPPATAADNAANLVLSLM